MWVPFDIDLVEHDYVFALAGMMDSSPVEAAGYVALLVSYGLTLPNDVGCVDDVTDKAIEKACCWMGERGELVRAFCVSGILQGSRDDDAHPLTICPALWQLLASKALKQREKWRKDKRNQRSN